MGMFDYVKSEIPLPDGWDGELQSKDFDCLMTTILITRDGRLHIERFEYETVPKQERPYPDSDGPLGLLGSLRKINRQWDDLNYHGDFYFGGLETLPEKTWIVSSKRDDGGWWQPHYKSHDYVARFTEGNLAFIKADPDA